MSANTTSTWVANDTLPSAFIGQPPNTQRDWYIVRGFLRLVGLVDTDPALGYVLAAKDNGANDGSKRPAVIGGLITCLVAISTVTIARLGLRASMSQMRFGLDDWATIAAAAMGLTYTTCQLIMAIKGGGDHIWQHTYEDYNIFNYYGTLDKLIFYVTVALIKISLTLFIRRLADRASKMWRWFCDFFLFTLALYILAATFWFCFTCDPPRAQWDRLYAGQLETPATCLSTIEWGIIFNVTHVVQGCILLLSPIVILWKVTMEIKKKIRLFAIWACGLLAVLFGLMRMLRANFTADIMWSYTELLIWTTLDVAVGIVVISLPVLDAWIASGARKAMTKMGRTRTGGLGKSGYGNLDKSSGYGSARTGKSMGTRNTSHGTSQDCGESEAEIIDRKDSPMELTIMRTDEYAVRFSAVDEEESRRFGGQASVTPGVDRDKFPGVAR
ncbi:hypothetical protein N0V82_006975 [Gnomoniopsis sp. IMI 355080]|nr:hypothetical protein N0V82_006975 [Gnomoniopsis sp. IMI 355080]